MGDKAAPSASDLEAKKSGMKKTTTKEGGELDPAALSNMEKLYSDNGGDLGKISSATGLKFKPGVEAKDGKDFAVKVLTGMIVADD